MGLSYGQIFSNLMSAVDPAAPATIHDDCMTSWADFDSHTDAIAAATHAAGAVPGDRIAHLMRNSPAYFETTVAGFKARLVHVNVNYRYTGEELFYILDNSDAAVLVYDAEFRDLIASIRHRLNVKLFLQVGGVTADFAQDYDAVAGSGARVGRQDHVHEDMLFIYTGGTTGLPKGVMWNQGDVQAAIGASVGLAPDISLPDYLEFVRAGMARYRALVLPPLMHGTGFLSALGVMSRGGTLVTIPGDNFDAELAVNMCAKHCCDRAVIVGDAFARPLLKALDAGHGSIASVAAMSSSGTMWSPEVKAGLLRHAPDMMIVDSLGSSEALAFAAAVQTKDNAGAATLFVGDERTLLLDENNQPVAPGERGRMARGGLVPRGYWRDETKSAATFVTINDARYTITGDWAILEADGSFTLLGRGSQCINTAGEKVFPEEVEEVLKTHPAIDDALVFGLPDEKWGQCVTAVVEAHEPVDAEALRAHVRLHLAGYKTPKTVHIVKKVPRAPNGKADYATAKAMVTG
ncbi:AMP-binding protein [Sandarakinorhabdus sp.]|uniref:AMP-binding protein n=1 Tax=Sandarakinorhabdus sp. TaxID=1916663 RepID=UPI00286D9657|nr:AMP-binding protein [Sandarakinorhabdus sp.]